MTYRRDGYGGDPADLPRYTAAELDKLEIELDTLSRQVRQLQRIAEVNGVVLLYAWDDTTDTTTAPPVGYIRGNAVQLASVTQFAISIFDAYGRRVLGGNQLRVGDLITVAAVDLSGSVVFQATADVVVFDDWIQLDVVAVATTSGYNPVQDDYIRVSWRPVDLTKV